MYVTMLDYVHISYMAWNYIMRTYTTTSDYMEVDNERTRIYLYKKLLYLNEVSKRRRVISSLRNRHIITVALLSTFILNTHLAEAARYEISTSPRLISCISYCVSP